MLNAVLSTLRERPSLQQALERVQARAPLRLEGLAGAHLAAVLSEIQAASGRPLAVVVPADMDLELTLVDVRGFHDAGSHPGAVVAFPPLEINPYGAVPAHDDIVRERLQTLDRCSRGRVDILLAPARCWMTRVQPPARFRQHSVVLGVGTQHPPETVIESLVRAGYRRVKLVQELGEFAVRGGILDVFPPTREQPVRVEFFGDEVESIREFNPRDQRSMRTIESIDLPPSMPKGADADTPVRRLEADGTPLSGRLADYLKDPLWVEIEPDILDRNIERWCEFLDEQYHEALARQDDAPVPDTLIHPAARALDRRRSAARVQIAELVGAGGAALRLAAQAAPVHRGRLAELAQDLDGELLAAQRVVFLLGRPGKAERLAEILEGYGITAALYGAAANPLAALEPGTCHIGVGELSAGFRVPELGLWVATDLEVFGRARPPSRRRRFHGEAFQGDFRDLHAGDYVIHEEHGIGRFVGVKSLEVSGNAREFMEIEYRGTDRLYLPLEQLYLVQKFRAGEEAKPRVDKLGGASWSKVKARVKSSLHDMAEDLLELYAARKAAQGRPSPPDTPWQRELEGSFEYDETADQLNAISEVKRDMESAAVMDRLLCGDVGYGKTEVAMRAAFKAVMDGRQVAVLAPTTVLAHQHWRTMQQRYAAFPLRVELLSRFRSDAEIRTAARRIRDGQADIAVGTHRLLSKDIRFHDLGLLVIDEEQRFGVSHKERLKKLKREIDVLSMTATPIPRTLQMSLLGVRDLSVIETAPKDRYAIATHIVGWDREIIANAIHEELSRGGQVFFVHNRIESIHRIAAALHELVPEAECRVAHGQLPKAELERVMLDFVEGTADVLITTAIIENGLDIPLANTIIVNHAERFGLAQLYQLRGRVGRSTRRAYAYLIVPPVDTLTPIAKKRLRAIQEFSDLGSGFRLAAMDLEIRGAGSLLGERQHGHIAAVGFEMYARLLEEAVHEIKGEPTAPATRAQVSLGLELQLPAEYIEDPIQRLVVSKRLGSARSEPQLEALQAELRDRYGPQPAVVDRLVAHAALRLTAEALGVTSIEREAEGVGIRIGSGAALKLDSILDRVASEPGWSLTPPDRLRVQLASREPAGVVQQVREVLESLT